MNEKELIEQFLDKLRGKIKVSKRTGKAYLPLNVIYAMKRGENPFEYNGLPWIFGAYTDGGFEIMNDMQDTPLYEHLYWANMNVILDKEFNIEDYLEHIIECPKCHQTFSDNYSDYAPSLKFKNEEGEALCSFCKHGDLSECNKNKDCNYEFKDEIQCKDCFFNGGILDPRMDKDENEINNKAKKFYSDREKEINNKEFIVCINNENWFGTLSKKYLLIDYSIIKVKDNEGNPIDKTFVIINDDYGQKIQLPIEYFEINN